MNTPRVGNLIEFDDSVFVVLGFDKECRIYGYRLGYYNKYYDYSKEEQAFLNKMQIQHYKMLLEQVFLKRNFAIKLRVFTATTHSEDKYISRELKILDGVPSEIVKQWYLNNMLQDNTLEPLVFDYDSVYQAMFQKEQELKMVQTKAKQKLLDKATFIMEKDLECGRVYKYPTSMRWLMYYKDNIFYTVTSSDYKALEYKINRGLECTLNLRDILLNTAKQFKQLPKVEKTDIKVKIANKSIYSKNILQAFEKKDNIDLSIFERE